ncbi:MAG: glycyl-radical enzyme activating protein [Bacillus sp. (in: Bacteria)]|nr:glycyl-radical enzyme activating protein [Bacillus sp. (in: firmicutes)]MCM1427488.1 glycyl-radical enzyme activating protein [Eubacterium sp.]
MINNLDVTGRIFDIQRYSIHDGVGIRTIVFLKGCALRCRWCCNPESQDYEIQTMLVNGKPKTIGRDVTVREVMDVVRRDMPYYGRSGGGLTLSGGESLLQPEFAAALLMAAKNMGISTAMESMGYAQFPVIEKILPYLDTYLMDIKHMNAAKHKEYTGKENTRMLENAKKIAQSRMCELIIRVPVIPGFNDSEQEILEIAVFADSLPGVSQIHLLPYHKYGEGKYEGLNRPYLMHGVPMLPDGKMEQLKEAVEKHTALACQIGG